MSPTAVNPSPDVLRLQDEGYEVEIRGTYLFVGHVPYVNAEKKIQYGTLVSTLHLSANQIIKPDTHVVSFAGSHPCHKDGSIMQQIQSGSETKSIEGVVVHHSFSNKPKDGYVDYYHKMTRYIEVISAPAKSLDESVTATTFRVIPAKPEESVFNYLDTNSGRAQIGAISDKLKGQAIGIIGLGGTGSYILDSVAKTPVSGIHLFDGDRFAQHNAFRAPGAPAIEQLREPPFKVNYFTEIYSHMHRQIHPYPEFVTATNLTRLSRLNFVFICIDDGPAKKVIVAFLEAAGIRFIDVGIGVQAVNGQLIGQVRTTTCIPEKRDHLAKLISFAAARDDAYATNIQIAELNMLNAAFAVIKWKKLCGFYQDLEREFHSTYAINVNQLESDHPGT